MLETLKKIISDPKKDAEKQLDKVRRDLATSASAQSILDVGAPLKDLVSALDSTIGGLEREIEAEAESVDRRRTIELRAERDKVFDLLTDAENLDRRIGEKHKLAMQAESEKTLKGIGTAAETKRLEIHQHIVEMAPAMRHVVDGAVRYKALLREFEVLNGQLEAAGRPDFRAKPVWRDIAQGEDFISMLGFLWQGDRKPEHITADFFKAVERLSK